MDAELWKQPAADERADNSNDEIADDSKPGALNDLTGQPSAMRPTTNMTRRLSPDMCILCPPDSNLKPDEAGQAEC